jgi:hypothetical protein
MTVWVYCDEGLPIGQVTPDDEDGVNRFRLRLTTEAVFAVIGKHVGRQPDKARRDMRFRFELHDVNYVVHVMTDEPGD